MEKDSVFASWFGTGTGLVISQLNEILGLCALILTIAYTAFRLVRDVRNATKNDQ